MKVNMRALLHFAVGVLLALVFVGCSHMLYAPSNRVFDLPEHYGLHYEEIKIQVNESPKEEITGWYFYSPKPKGLFVFFHGNGENLSSHFRALTWILEENYDFFIFDYRGYGPSDGKPSPKNTVEDGLAALKEMKRIKPKLPIWIYGQSLGGAVALRSVMESADLNIRGIILDSTFASYDDAAAGVVASRWYTWLFQPLARLLVSDRYSPQNALQNNSHDSILKLKGIPKLVMHGTEDSLVSIKLGRKLYAELPEPKQFLEIPKARHIEGFFVENGKYRKSVLEWMKELK